MIIIEDTREGLPLLFNKKYIDYVMHHKLDYGDYACVADDGTWAPFIFERKSVPDLMASLTTDYARVKNEINRSIKDKVQLIIIVEKSLSDVVKGHKYTKVNGLSVVRTMFTLLFRHKIPFVCCDGRRDMALYIQEAFFSWEKNNDTKLAT